MEIVNDLEIVKLKVNLPNQDTPLIRTLSSSPMTVRIRGVSLYFFKLLEVTQTTDGGQRTTTWVWHKHTTGELKTVNSDSLTLDYSEH